MGLLTNSHRYDDIIHLPHHVSPHHAHMPVQDRAAQFAPFAALTGFDAVVRETARLTQQPVELDESEQWLLDQKLQLLARRLEEKPQITVTFFQPDPKKEGGQYLRVAGQVQKIDPIAQIISLGDGLVIPMRAIVAMDGAIFASFDLLGSE